jgi:hypothetical protein
MPEAIQQFHDHAVGAVVRRPRRTVRIGVPAVAAKVEAPAAAVYLVGPSVVQRRTPAVPEVEVQSTRRLFDLVPEPI